VASKAQSIKEKNNELHFIKIQEFCSSKITTREYP
jgi:hypothetical protein